MIDRIGQQSSLARAAIEAALKRQSEALKALEGGAATASARAPDAPAASDFVQTLREVDAQVKRADELALDVASGRVVDFHEVAAQLKQSELSLRFALEVRNKFVDAYREVMRMSV